MDSTSNSPKERTATTPPLQPDQKHKKACEACRSLKVRCLPDPSPAATKCQRCTRFNRVCIFGVSARRRPRKRTDTRVKELEQELRAVRSLLRHDSASGPASSVGGPTVQTASDSGHDGLSPQHISAHSDSPETGSLTGSMDDRDIIQKGWLSIELATELFQLYNRELMPCYPIVVFHPDTTVDDVRTQTPTLFLVIMGSAAGKDHPQLCRLLNREFLRVYADMVIINSKKSLELVQCMLLSAVWYYPPDRFEDLKYYQYIHMVQPP